MIFQRPALCYAAGTVGALANSAVAVLVGQTGFPAALGVQLAPQLSPGWLYPRLVWGGLWGLLFVLPLTRGFFRSLLVSLIPASFQLFVVFPSFQGKGMLGHELGWLTPLFVVSYNLVWGWSTYLFLKAARA